MSSNRPLAREIQLLREKIGSRLSLQEDAQEVPCHIVAELEISGEFYACLLPQDARRDDLYIYRYQLDGDHHRVEPIEDDQEWEQVADAYDEWLYFKHKENG
ncbi:MAG: DUF1292 domain-containing protein [Bacillaceae bacterium]|nr:DUF1292 domain-containing protein [Bacillaceae bacterium]